MKGEMNNSFNKFKVVMHFSIIIFLFSYHAPLNTYETVGGSVFILLLYSFFAFIYNTLNKEDITNSVLRSFIDDMRHPITFKNINGNYKYCNSLFLDLFELEKQINEKNEDCYKNSFFDKLSKEDVNQIVKCDIKLIRNLKLNYVKINYKDNVIYGVNFPYFNDNKDLIGILTFWYDTNEFTCFKDKYGIEE